MYKTIADIPDEGYQLITDSQDVFEVLAYLGNEVLADDYQGLFVKVGEGDYEEVYAFAGTVPELHKPVEKLL